MISTPLMLLSAIAGLSTAAPHGNKTAPAEFHLQGAIDQINGTHIRIDITNPNRQQIALLAQHTLFHQGTEYHSLSVRPAGNASHPQNEPPGPGSGAVRYIYPKPAGEESFVTINANSTWKTVLDITQAFQMPNAGPYQINVQSKFKGVPFTQRGENGTIKGHFTGVNIDTKPIVFNLAASPTSKKRRDTTTDALAGCANSRSQVTTAISNAAAMASDAAGQVTGNTGSFNTFFGVSPGNPDDLTYNRVTHTVRGTYIFITNYDPTKDTHITWNCANQPGQTLPYCNDGGTLGYYQYKTSSINLCNSFFSKDSSDACTGPSTSTQSIEDQVSIVLHELTHDPTFGAQDVNDWKDNLQSGDGNYCYNYNCALDIAKKRNPMQLPEASAINLEQFAQDARHNLHPNAPCYTSNDISIGAPTPPTALQADQNAAICIGCYRG